MNAAPAAAPTSAAPDTGPAEGHGLTAAFRTPAGLWIAMAIAVAWHAASVWLAAPTYNLDDAYYHLHQARMLGVEGLFAGITSLPRTVLGEAGTDHHFLFHLLLLPCAQLPDALALPVAAAAIASLASVGMIAALHALRVGWLPLWALLLLGTSEVYGFRVALVRAQSVDLPIVLLAVALLVQGRAVAAAFLGFAFAWLHHGSLLVVPIALAVVAAGWLVEGRVGLRAPLWLCLGTAAGFLVNPWFPHDIEYLLFHVLFKTRNPLGLDVGGEWLPALPSYLLVEAWPLHLALAVAAAAWAREATRRRRQPSLHPERGDGFRAALPSTEALALFGLTALFAAMTLRHGRFADHWVALQWASVAVLGRDAMAQRNPADTVAAGPGLQQAHGGRPQSGMRGRVMAFAVVVGAALALVRLQGVAAILRQGSPVSAFAPVGAYLDRHAQKGELVVNLQWEDYSFLIFHAPRQRFLVGLDPNYLAYGDPVAFRTWAALNAEAPVPGGLSAALRKDLSARLLVGPPGYAQALARQPALEVVFRSPAAWVWRLRDAG